MKRVMTSLCGLVLVGWGAGCGETCQLQGACPNLGPDETYDNCCIVGGTCTFRFTDGHTVGPYNPGDAEAAEAALEEASAYCLAEGGEGEGEGEGDGAP